MPPLYPVKPGLQVQSAVDEVSEFELLGQPEHDAAPSPDDFPVSQFVHDESPAVEYVPDGQAAHDAASAAGYFPAGQSWHNE